MLQHELRIYRFLFRTQIEEADLICFNKTDRQTESPNIAGRRRYLSALTGQGVAEWLDEVLAGEIPSGGKILDIDYERYARAEAALGMAKLQRYGGARPALSPAMLMGPLLEEMQRAFTAEGLRIVHLKLAGRFAVGLFESFHRQQWRRAAGPWDAGCITS